MCIKRYFLRLSKSCKFYVICLEHCSRTMCTKCVYIVPVTTYQTHIPLTSRNSVSDGPCSSDGPDCSVYDFQFEITGCPHRILGNNSLRAVFLLCKLKERENSLPSFNFTKERLHAGWGNNDSVRLTWYATC